MTRAKKGRRQKAGRKARLLNRGFPNCKLAEKSILRWIPGPLF